MNTFENNDHFPMLPILFFVVGWGCLALLLSWAGLFHSIFFILYIIVCGGSFWYIQRKGHLKNTKTKEVALVSISFFIIAITLTILFQPTTFFTGRDQGAMSVAAIELAENHQLSFVSTVSKEFFDIYGPGKALNFPGFYYTQNGELITQFPVAYIAWLASFYALFGIYGFILANAALLFTFFLSLYGLARSFISQNWSLALITLLATSFPIFWFSRFTLSENLALAMLWTMILGFVLFYKRPSPLFYWLFLTSGSLLFFTRIEGILLFTIGSISLVAFQHTRRFIASSIWKRCVIPIAIIGMLSLVSITVNTPFYTTIGKALLSSDANLTNEASESLGHSLLSDQIYLFNTYWLYGLALAFIVGIAAIGYFFLKRRSPITMFLPLLIVFPTFIYLIHPFISPDHPWFLRRLMFSVTPIFLLYAVILMAHLREKERTRIYAYALLVALFVAQLPTLFYFFPYIGDRHLMQQTHALAQEFDDTDLILVDRLASGDAWTMLAGPLNTHFERNAVYFFNPQDYEKIQKEHFSAVYLLVAENNLQTYMSSPLSQHMLFKGSFSLSTYRLMIDPENATAISWPEKGHVTHSIHIYQLDAYAPSP